MYILISYPHPPPFSIHQFISPPFLIYTKNQPPLMYLSRTPKNYTHTPFDPHFCSHIACDMCLGKYLVGGELFLTKMFFFPAWGWWFGLTNNSGGVYFFAMLGVVGRGVNCNCPGVVINYHSMVTFPSNSVEWVRTIVLAGTCWCQTSVSPKSKSTKTSRWPYSTQKCAENVS